jgi:hypothetical protein
MNSVVPSGVWLKSEFAESGGYIVQAPPKAPPSTKNDASRISAESRKIWYESRLIFGNTMSSAPIISGIRKLPKAAISTGIATQKIMIAPWFVISELYSFGETSP